MIFVESKITRGQHIDTWLWFKSAKVQTVEPFQAHRGELLFGGLYFFAYFSAKRQIRLQWVMRKPLGLEKPVMTDLQRKQIKLLRLQGISYVKIGEMLGISDNTVRSFCRRNGLGHTAKNSIACKQCGKLIKIVLKQKPRKFCSDACRTAWWNSHLDYVNRKAIYEYTCAHCGKPFTAYGNKGRKYCSHECYIADRFGEERGCCD